MGALHCALPLRGGFAADSTAAISRRQACTVKHIQKGLLTLFTSYSALHANLKLSRIAVANAVDSADKRRIAANFTDFAAQVRNMLVECACRAEIVYAPHFVKNPVT